ncbi:alpha/beta-hydrolase [Mycena leptocephala]|nr:alpha/beta-hydrolase [Mycena leptocephala]
MSLCKACIKGVTHNDTPEGIMETIGVECYVVTPTVDYPEDKVLLYLTDAFGFQLPLPPKTTSTSTSGSEPTAPKMLAALKATGVTSSGAVDFCYGGRLNLAFDGAITAAAVAHPSLLNIPANLEKYGATATALLLINSCEVDRHFPPEAGTVADALFSGFALGYKRADFEGCTHGDPKIKGEKEGAFKGNVEWMAKRM